MSMRMTTAMNITLLCNYQRRKKVGNKLHIRIGDMPGILESNWVNMKSLVTFLVSGPLQLVRIHDMILLEELFGFVSH